MIAAANTAIPQAVGPMLDQVSALMNTIPKDNLAKLLDETYNAFNGTGYDFGSMLDSASTISRDANGISDNTRALTDDAGPFLNAQAQTTDSIRTWARSLAGITDQVATDDPQFRSILQKGPGFAQETSKLLERSEADAADLAGESDHNRSDRRDLQRVSRTAAGAVAAVRRQLRRRTLPSNSPNGVPVRRFLGGHRRPGGVHHRLPAAVGVALPGRHRGH